METAGAFELPLRRFSGNQLRTVRQEIEGATVQTCVALRGFERLAVLKYGQVTLCRAGGSPLCEPIRVHRDGQHTLIYGTAVDSNEDDEEYTASPLSSVKSLLCEHADHEIELANAGTPQQADFEWWKGGAMQKFAHKPLKECISAVRETMATCFHAKQHLQFVYDIVPSDTPFSGGELRCSLAVFFSLRHALARTDFAGCAPHFRMGGDAQGGALSIFLAEKQLCCGVAAVEGGRFWHGCHRVSYFHPRGSTNSSTSWTRAGSL